MSFARSRSRSLDHHEGYIDWQVYESNQKVITDNENARSGVVRGAIKNGEALLAGLLRCGHCGQYPRPHVIRYQCSGYILNRDQVCCVMFGGLRAHRLVSEQLLQCLAPLGLGAAMEAIEALQGASDDRIKQKRLALERARYEVTHARRRRSSESTCGGRVGTLLESSADHRGATRNRAHELAARLRAPTQRRTETGVVGVRAGSPDTLGRSA